MQISDIPVGGMLAFGSYGFQDLQPSELIWIKLSQENDFCTASIIDLCQFDAPELTKTDIPSQAYHGNNCYWESNIDQFLNSAEEHWFTPRHEHDHPPVGTIRRGCLSMASRPGFLRHFTPEELSMLQDREISCRVPYGRKKEFKQDYITITRKVALPSYNELCPHSGSSEGHSFAHAIAMSPDGLVMRMKFSYSDDISQSFGYINSPCASYMLRTPAPNSRCSISCVSNNGMYLETVRASEQRGVVPVIRIRSDAEIMPLGPSETIFGLSTAVNRQSEIYDSLMALLAQ